MDIEQFNEVMSRLSGVMNKEDYVRYIYLLVDDLNRRNLLLEAKIAKLEKQMGNIDAR